MREALIEVRESLGRLQKPDRDCLPYALLTRLKECIDRGIADQQEAFKQVDYYTKQVCRVIDLISPDSGDATQRETRFEQLQQAFAKQPDDPICVHMAKLMKSFRAGLFAGEDIAELPRDNLALERWFRHPKSHERKIHGHQHTGTRIVQEGPTLLPTLDAHLSRTGIFTSDELKPYANATMPESQKASRARHGIMVKGRSKKKKNRPPAIRATVSPR